MAKRATQKQMNFLTKLPSQRLKDLKTGAGLVARTNYTIDELREKATVERIRFAASLHRQAQQALKLNPPAYRLSISRAYYSMYHSFRAVVYFEVEGDEHEKHSELPKHIPKSFPSRAYWENTLKHARLQRNKADYEPYPTREGSWASIALQLTKESKMLRTVVRTYLRGKGLIL